METDDDFLNGSFHGEIIFRIFFKDEVKCTRDGVIDFYSLYLWSDEIPRAIPPDHHQIFFKINVYCGVIWNQLLGLFSLPLINGENYLEFLQVRPEDTVVAEIPLDLRQNIWYMNDGSLVHFFVNVRYYSNNTYGSRLIGCGGPCAWSDLILLDF